SGRLLDNAGLDDRLLNGWDLYEHQREGVRRALQMRRLVLAFDMGLGKTVVGCVWSRSFLRTLGGGSEGDGGGGNSDSDGEGGSSDDEGGRKSKRGLKILVIAPVSLHDDWRRTAEEATGLRVRGRPGKGGKGDKKKKKKARGGKKKDETRTVTGKPRRRTAAQNGSDDEVSSWGSSSEDDDDEEEDEGADPSDGYDMTVLSWSSVGAHSKRAAGDGDYVVVADEAHHMQSMDSKRTREALDLMSPRRCRGALLLTGTPMKNGKPTNLFPLLRAVRHPFGDDQRRYEFYFCAGQQRSWGWDAAGSSNLGVLGAHTSSHVFRMTKEECLGGELAPEEEGGRRRAGGVDPPGQVRQGAQGPGRGVHPRRGRGRGRRTRRLERDPRAVQLTPSDRVVRQGRAGREPGEQHPPRGELGRRLHELRGRGEAGARPTRRDGLGGGAPDGRDAPGEQAGHGRPVPERAEPRHGVHVRCGRGGHHAHGGVHGGPGGPAVDAGRRPPGRGQGAQDRAEEGVPVRLGQGLPARRADRRPPRGEGGELGRGGGRKGRGGRRGPRGSQGQHPGACGDGAVGRLRGG
ncbi:hypothetical protein THAOC_22476, partial [Thalassiosira oceanica]